MATDQANLDPRFTQILEERRRSTLDLIYATPGLSLTAQAFIFSITLAPNTSAVGRIIGASVGVVAGVATAISMLKHNYTEEMYGAILDDVLSSAGLSALHRKKLSAMAPHSDADEDFNRWERVRWRKWAKQIRSTDLWIYSLFLFALVDVVILGLSIADAAGAGLLSQD